MSGAERSDIHARCSFVIEETSSVESGSNEGRSKSMSIILTLFHQNGWR